MALEREVVLERLTCAVQKRLGSGVTLDAVVMPTLGGSNQTVVFDVVEAGGARRRLVSRSETFTGTDSPFIPPSFQFKLLRAAHSRGIPVPEPVFEFDDADGLGRGYTMGFVGGETLPKKILNDPGLADARERLTSQSGEILARLHAIPITELSFLEDTADSRDPLAAQLSRLDRYREAHPAVEVGVRWLKTHPLPSAPRQLVHGDFRTGNFIVGERGIEAVLDWECAHLGSGMEDLGWLCVRSWRFGKVDKPVGGFGLRAELFRAYAAASGVVPEPEVVHWWEVFGNIRWVILNVLQAYGNEFEGRRSVSYAACGRNASLYEYDLLMTLAGRYD